MSGSGQRRAPGGPADLSPGVTTVAFDPIIPPLRVPIPAGANDDPSNGEWLLAFKDDESWRRGWHMCHGRVSEQCELGARMGCSISAANVCRVPWWKQALAFMKVAKLGGAGEREACEEREMTACLASSKEACTEFARDTCDPVFADARIAESHVQLDPRFAVGSFRRRALSKDSKPQSENASEEKDPEAWLANSFGDSGGNAGTESSGLESPQVTTNYRGSKLMNRESVQKSWEGPDWSEGTVEGGTLSGPQGPVDGWEGGLIRPKFDSRRK